MVGGIQTFSHSFISEVVCAGNKYVLEMYFSDSAAIPLGSIACG